MAEPKLKTIQARFGFADEDLKTIDHDRIMQWVDRNCEDIVMDLFKLSSRPSLVVKWERAIYTLGRDFQPGQMIGFVDLVAYDKDWEQIHARRRDRKCPAPKRYLFEIKVKMPTAGELLRQINMYREGLCLTPCEPKQCYFQDSFIVVSSCTEYEKTLRDQGVEWYQYVEDKSFAFLGKG